MHELALLTSVVRAVERAIADTEGAVPRVVALRVGSLSGANPEALTSVWPLAVAGGPFEDAQLVLEVVPAEVWCPDCESEVEIDEFYELRCPSCGLPTANLTRGRDLEIAYVDIDVP